MSKLFPAGQRAKFFKFDVLDPNTETLSSKFVPVEEVK